MNKYRAMSCIRILALILLVLLLPGCSGGKAKETAVPPATATTGGQGGVPATVAVSETNTPLAEGAASPTPGPAAEATATDTTQPAEEPPVPTSTEAAAPTDTAEPTVAAPSTQQGELYEPIRGCARSRLHMGDIIRGAPEIQYVSIRSTFDTHPADNIIRKLFKSELARITSWPACSYGWIMWPIQTADGTRGWVPETNGTDFWLVNVNGMFFPSATPPNR